MMNELKKRTVNQKGLTLIELLAVIVILAIIAAIAIPAIGNIISNSRDKAVLSESLNIISGAKIAQMDGQCGTDNSCSATELKEYVDGVVLNDSIVVAYSPTNKEWSIKNPEISTIGDKFKPTNSTDDTYEETEIKIKLDPASTTSQTTP